ncbi:hypothetical protein IDJ77_12845 [Mucilaginibacter sp. ZT4R22]|uniref:Uncharacterized protein n=1 Tax=Mucilaginibacter pankratovii TaxID=2772110 RepID=A0ABR7WQV8_9SPHI|nr:hypothetical protein [Mucilaginibacter pankratovii]MBD1364700.1 hypothetical protein [Mucilaginibacter pankratovii]
MRIRISERAISISLVALAILTLLFAYGYVNSMVSYKYEVQDFQQAGKEASFGLDAHQLYILHGITFCKYAAISCFALLILGLIINEREPTFNGRISYTSKIRD